MYSKEEMRVLTGAVEHEDEVFTKGATGARTFRECREQRVRGGILAGSAAGGHVEHVLFVECEEQLDDSIVESFIRVRPCPFHKIQ